MTETAVHPIESRPRLAEKAGTPAIEIREILFPTDQTPQSALAFEHARLLAERFGARVTLYHVVQAPPLTAATDPDDPQFEALRRAEVRAHEHLDRLAGRLPGARVRIERAASIHRALLRRIEESRPDLTVMSTHGRDGLARLVRGSVAEMVVQFGRTPVLCVREPEHGAALPYRRILVPTDLSPASCVAFPIAGELARAFGAEVLALHVAPPPRGAAESGTAGISYAVETRLPSEQDLGAFVAPEFHGVALLPLVEIGSAWDRIIEVARAERADAIVMSTHGKDSLADRVIGSHADRVIRHAPCPVLVV